jgi:hypothetical protein
MSTEKATSLSNFFGASLGMTVGIIGIAIAAFKSLEKAFEMGMEAARMELLRSTMQQMAAKDGVDFVNIMQQVNDKVGNSVSKFTQLRTAMSLSMMDVSWKEIPRLMEFIETRSKLIGKSFEDTATIVERASMGNKKAIISLQLPIFNAKDAYDEYAKSIGTTGDMLSEVGQKHAVFQKMLKEGEEQHLNINQAVVDEVEKFESLGTAWKNLTETGGKFATALSFVSEQIAVLLTDLNNLLNGKWRILAEDLWIDLGGDAGYREARLALKDTAPGELPAPMSLPPGGAAAVDYSGDIDQAKVDKKRSDDKKAANQALVDANKRREEGLKASDKFFKELEEMEEKKEKDDQKHADNASKRHKKAAEEREKLFGATAKGKWKKFNDDLQKEFETTNILIDGTNSAISGLANGMSSAFSAMIQGTVNIGQGFAMMRVMVIQALTEIIAKMMAMFILQQLLGLFTGGASTIVSGAGMGFSTAASGGDFSYNKPQDVLVGEKGIELMQVRRDGVRVISNNNIQKMNQMGQASNGSKGMSISTVQLESRIEGETLVTLHQVTLQSRQGRIG